MPPRKHEPSGQTFGRWTVISEAERRGSSRMWRCRCECGQERDVYLVSLLNGMTSSCGCFRVERVIASQTRHGMCNTPEYRAWAKLIDRCVNPRNNSFEHYGGRGISVCDRWKHSFENFLADMGPRPSPQHSIERSNNDGNYDPKNCFWATRKEQANNTSRTRRIVAFGEALTLPQWSRRTGLPETTIRSRLRSGWSPERALETPKAKHGVKFHDDKEVAA